MINLKNKKFKVDYVMIAAMEEELEFLTEKFANLKCIEIKIGELFFKIYDYQSHKVLVSPTGVGTTFSACILTLINSHFDSEYFFICGTAGGIKADLKLRDVIIAEKAFEAEIQDIFAMLKNTPFESCLKHPIKNEYFPAHYSANLELLNICNSLSISDIRIHKGTVVSSNAFPAPKELFDKIKKFDPYSIDMETSAFYQTAWLLNIKIVAIRGISNVLNADGTDEKVHESDVKGSSDAAAKVLLTILDRMIALNNNQKRDLSSQFSGEALKLISEYNLQPHTEGGYFTQLYKSNDTVKLVSSDRYQGETRQANTSIYYLLNKKEYSAWHILKSDEIWYFHKGSPLNVHLIDENGNLTTYLLGDSLEFAGANFQVCIKAGTLFSAENIDKNSYSLIGCMVAPGFEYGDFNLADKNTLLAAYPQHRTIIERLLSKV